MKRLPWAAATAAIFASAAASAAITNPATTSFNVLLHIDNECRVGTVSNINFGTTGYITSDIDGSTTINVGCTKGTVATIKLSDGGNYSSGTRHMKNTATGNNDLVAYELYTDASRTNVWTSSLATQTVTGNGVAAAGVPANNQATTVYARVPASNSGYSPGDYSDTVQVSVYF